jgi:hypothetical protein
MTAITLNLEPITHLTHEFYELCMANKDAVMERSATGELIMVSKSCWAAGSENG